LNEAVERKSFKSVGSRFQAWGAATEKALSPIFRLVLGMTVVVVSGVQLTVA